MASAQAGQETSKLVSLQTTNSDALFRPANNATHRNGVGPSNPREDVADPSTSSEGRPKVFWRLDANAPDGRRPMRIHLPLYLPDRAALRTQVTRHGGIDERFAKSDVVIIDTDTPANSLQARELFRQARGLPQPLPCVAPSWITDSIKAGVAQNVRNAVYDPVRLLDELEKKEERKKKVQESDELRLAAMMRSEVLRNPAAVELHQFVKLPGKNLYTALDNHNIVEHLAQTKSTWAGGKVSDELVAKYGRHSRWSYQSYLRDNLEKGAFLRLRTEEYLRTGVNPIKISPRLRLTGGGGHYVGDANFNIAQQPKKASARRDRGDSDGEGFEEESEGEGGANEEEDDEDDDPIVTSGEQAERPRDNDSASNQVSSSNSGRLSHLGAIAPRGNLRGYRPHGTISNLDSEMERRRELADQQAQAMEAAKLDQLRLREESRPVDEPEEDIEDPQHEEGVGNHAVRPSSETTGAAFTNSEKHLLANLVMKLLVRALHDGILEDHDIEGDGNAALEHIQSRPTMSKGQRMWQTLHTKHPDHSPDEWADHFWRNIEHYVEAGKVVILGDLEDVATQQLQATQAPNDGTIGEVPESGTVANERAGESQPDGLEDVAAKDPAHEEAVRRTDVADSSIESPARVPADAQAMLLEALNDYLEEEELDELEALEDSQQDPANEGVDSSAALNGQAHDEIEGPPIIQEAAVDTANGATDMEIELSPPTAADDQRAKHHDAKVSMKQQFLPSDNHNKDRESSPTEEVAARVEKQTSSGANAASKAPQTPSGVKRRRDEVDGEEQGPRQRRISSNAAIRASEAANAEAARATSTSSALATPSRAERSHASSTSGVPTVGSHSKIRYLDLSKEEIEVEEVDEESAGEGSVVLAAAAAPPPPPRSAVAEGKRRQTDDGTRRQSREAEAPLSRRSGSINTSALGRESRNQGNVNLSASRREPPASRRDARGGSRERASSLAEVSNLSSSRSFSRSLVGGGLSSHGSTNLEKEEAKLALQRRCLRLAKKYGFSSMRQVTPFISAAGLDTIKGEELILQRFDVLAEEYRVEREIVIEYVREAQGSIELAEKFLRLAEISSRSRESFGRNSRRTSSRSAAAAAGGAAAGGGGGGGSSSSSDLRPGRRSLAGPKDRGGFEEESSKEAEEEEESLVDEEEAEEEEETNQVLQLESERELEPPPTKRRRR